MCQRGPRDITGARIFAPAMIALLTDPLTGAPCGVHRTFLEPDGSAKAAIITTAGGTKLKPKTILGSWGCVRLTPDDDISRALGVTEGIEDALTCQQAAGWGPVWACGTASGIANFPLLPGIESLTIFADADLAGKSAALACSKRWVAAGREVGIYSPPHGSDWNSLHMGQLAREGLVNG